MQPTLVVSAPVKGVIYLNGRFAGECAPDAPLFFPVAARGANYLEYRPLARGARPLARKLVLSGGRPVAVPEDVYCVLWPGGALETELDCEAGERLRVGRAELPAGAEDPERVPLADGELLLGAMGEGRYAATLNHDGALTGFARFTRLRHTGQGRLECVTDRGDLVGHAVLERWQAAGSGLKLLLSEGVWTHGAPRWPQSAEDAALAAFQAALAGLEGEADGYLAPELRGRGLPGALAAGASACGAVKYAPPDAHSAVALFFREEERLAVVRCARFRCTPAGGQQGPWQVAAMWTEE